MSKYLIDSTKIANNIRAERNRVNLTQEEVANYLGISTRTYISYEKDAKRVMAITLYNLSKIFKCDIDAFYLN